MEQVLPFTLSGNNGPKDLTIVEAHHAVHLLLLKANMPQTIGGNLLRVWRSSYLWIRTITAPLQFGLFSAVLERRWTNSTLHVLSWDRNWLEL